MKTHIVKTDAEAKRLHDLTEGASTLLVLPVDRKTVDIDGGGNGHIPCEADGATWDNFDFRRAWVDNGPSPAGNPGPYLHVPLRVRMGGVEDETVHRLYPIWSPGDIIGVTCTWWHYHAPATNPRNEKAWDAITRTVRWPSGEVTEGVTPYVEAFRWGGPGTVGWEKCSSAKMPDWAIRTRLLVESVEARQVQSITNDESESAGVHRGDWEYEDGECCESASEAYAHMWDRRHPKQPWAFFTTARKEPKP